MRFHFIECFEGKQIDHFPRTVVLEHRNQAALIQKVPLHCSCRMPENEELYFTCSMCKKWFQTACEGLEQKKQEAVLCEVFPYS